MSNEPKQVVRRYLDALLDGDVEAIRRSFAEDAVWSMHADLPMAGPWRGREAIVDDFLLAFGGSLYEQGSQRFEFPTLIGEGELVALEWRVEARSAAGAEYENAYCGIFVVRDGCIQEVREYFDTEHTKRVLFPSPLAAALSSVHGHPMLPPRCGSVPRPPGRGEGL